MIMTRGSRRVAVAIQCGEWNQAVADESDGLLRRASIT